MPNVLSPPTLLQVAPALERRCHFPLEHGSGSALAKTSVHPPLWPEQSVANVALATLRCGLEQSVLCVFHQRVVRGDQELCHFGFHAVEFPTMEAEQEELLLLRHHEFREFGKAMFLPCLLRSKARETSLPNPKS
jgi:hypothetical protein